MSSVMSGVAKVDGDSLGMTYRFEPVKSSHFELIKGETTNRYARTHYCTKQHQHTHGSTKQARNFSLMKVRQEKNTHGSGGNLVITFPPVNFKWSSINFGSTCLFPPGLCNLDRNPSVNMFRAESTGASETSFAFLAAGAALGAFGS